MHTLIAPLKLSKDLPSSPLTLLRTGRAIAHMTKPQNPSSPTASKAGTLYCKVRCSSFSIGTSFCKSIYLLKEYLSHSIMELCHSAFFLCLPLPHATGRAKRSYKYTEACKVGALCSRPRQSYHEYCEKERPSHQRCSSS